MELDPDQLRVQKLGPKQTKAPAGASGSTATPAPLTRKRAASSSKKPAAPKTAVTPSLPPSGEAEDDVEATETPEEPLTRRKRSRTEPAVAPEVSRGHTVRRSSRPGVHWDNPRGRSVWRGGSPSALGCRGHLQRAAANSQPADQLGVESSTKRRGFRGRAGRSVSFRGGSYSRSGDAGWAFDPGLPGVMAHSSH